MSKTFAAGLIAIAQLASADHFRDYNGNLNMRFNPNNRFKIMQFTDLHFGESPEADETTEVEIKELIRKETPDFVAVTGDIVSGFMWNQTKDEPDFWKRNFGKMATILEADGIPFGFVPGWHDFDADVN